jgi:hypothetical protein
VACGGATRPDGDDPRRQLDEMSGDTASRRQDAGGNDDGLLYCTTIAVFGLDVTIEDPPVSCNELAIVATAVGYAETLECFDSDGLSCKCSGAMERSGTYQISASTGAPPIELARAGPIVVQADGCHVIARSVRLRLAALPADAGAVSSLDAGAVSSLDAGAADAGDAARP